MRRVRKNGVRRAVEMQLVPALGLVWANCVTVRLMLSRLDTGIDTETAVLRRDGGATDDPANPRATTHRRLHVLVAPHLPHGALRFHITDDGIVGVASRV